MNKQNIIVSVIVSLAVSFLALTAGGGSSATLGGRVETIRSEFGGGIQLTNGGTRGTVLQLIKTGTCSLITSGSITASSTGSVDCIVAGARSGDLVDITLSASTTNNSLFIVKSAQASSTSGYVTVQLYNMTGATRDPGSVNGFGSSTIYKLWRTSNNF